jgi:hypothetical protein
MAASRRLWVPVLVALLVAVLLGPAGGGGAVAAVTLPEPQVLPSIMIPAAAFTSLQDDWDWSNNGYYLVAGASSAFAAPVPLPIPVGDIKRLTL